MNWWIPITAVLETQDGDERDARRRGKAAVFNADKIAKRFGLPPQCALLVEAQMLVATAACLYTAAFKDDDAAERLQDELRDVLNRYAATHAKELPATG